MKRFAIFFSLVAFFVAVAAFAIAVANYLARKREMLGFDDDFDEDDLFDGDLDFYAEPLDTGDGLSVEAEGNTAPIGTDADSPAESKPQEH